MKKRNKTDKSTATNELKPEDFNWLDDDDATIQNEKLKIIIKEKFSLLPLTYWKSLIDKEIKDIKKYRNTGKLYQNEAYIILRDDLFVNQKLFKEPNEYELVKIFEDIGDIEIDIYPDFVIKEIKKEDLLNILKKFDFMLRYDTITNKLAGKDYINFVGEIKKSPTSSKAISQRKKYLDFVKALNKQNEGKNIYYMFLYIFDESFGTFWLKTFFEGEPAIIGYIPQFYKEDSFKKQKTVKFGIKKEKKKYLKSNFINMEIIRPNFDIKNERKNMYLDESTKDNNKIENKEIIDVKKKIKKEKNLINDNDFIDIKDKETKGEQNKTIKIIIKKEDEIGEKNKLLPKREYLMKKEEKIKEEKKKVKPEEKKPYIALIKDSNIINLQEEEIEFKEIKKKKSSQEKDININMKSDNILLGKKIHKIEKNE